jgi:hypothetical protein
MAPKHAAAVDIINRAHHRREPNELLDCSPTTPSTSATT